MNAVAKYIKVTSFLVFFGLLIIIKDYLANTEEEAPTSVARPVVTIQNTPVSAPVVSQSNYKDGTFTGTVEDAYYGNLQVQAVIKNGEIVDIIFLQYPNDNRTSLSINTESNLYLKEEAIAIQGANVNIVSGASDSSFAFRKSMASALKSAQK